MTILSAIVLLGILIFVHELGHFIVAKLMKVKVEKFSLGFGPKLLGKTIGETEYRISAFPLGGYVKMLGENPGEEQEEPLSEAERARAYNRQPVRKRFLIVFAGPFFNIVFAALVFVVIFMTGFPSLLPEVGEVMEDTPAARAGLQNGDRIAAIEGAEIRDWSDMTTVIFASPGKALDFEVRRGEEILSMRITPEKRVEKNIFGEEKEIGLIGIKPSGAEFTRSMGFSEAVSGGFRRTVEIIWLTVVALIKLVQRVIPADTLGGPILIFQMAGQQASQGATNFFNFMAIISINLGIINLFPIPILDGGHLVFLGLEAVRRKPASERTVILAQKVGLVVILLIMALALYNDIVRVVTGRGFP
jgi:regulator of sigma E protease